MLGYKDDDHVRLVSRHGVDHTARFTDLAAAIGKLRPGRLVLDGEIAVFDEKLVSQFHLLNDPTTDVLATPPIFMAFDCLWLEDRDLRSEPLKTRRRALADAVDGASLILPTRRLPDDGLEAWRLVKDRGYEGLVAKNNESRYETGESRNWIKIKFRQERSFIVGGIGTRADGAPRLLVGERVKRRLVYRGAVDLGVGTALVTELMARCQRRSSPPFDGLAAMRGVIWLEPKIQIVVSYGRMAQGWLREPLCRGIA
jgi:bifunctional non-homologous end joining protein LigD